MDDNESVFCVGDLFSSNEELERELNVYQEETQYCFTATTGKKLESVKNIRPDYNRSLIYDDRYYRCSVNPKPKTFRHFKKKNPNIDFVLCPAFLTLRTTQDKQYLLVTKFNGSHDHSPSARPRLEEYLEVVKENIAQESVTQCHKKVTPIGSTSSAASATVERIVKTVNDQDLSDFSYVQPIEEEAAGLSKVNGDAVSALDIVKSPIILEGNFDDLLFNLQVNIAESTNEEKEKKISRVCEMIESFKVHTDEKTYRCNICNKTFSYKFILQCHLRCHTGQKAFKCNMQFSQSAHLWDHTRVHTGEKPFKCNICNKQFSHKKSLVRHERVHTGEKPFKCNICNKAFSQPGELLRHKRVHTGEKPFKCNMCNKQFSFKNSLVLHERVHTGEKPFKCHVCNKHFSCKSNMKKHERVHTGEKSFKCNVCDKQFSRKATLVGHVRLHTGEKPFKCHVCSKHFSSKQNLILHERVHTGEKPLKCNICNKQFLYKTSLVHHERIHTGEKPFKCNICNKKFLDKKNLRRHERVHTGEKPFKCNICKRCPKIKYKISNYK